MAALPASHPSLQARAALRSNSFEVIAEQEERGIFAFRRWSTEDQQAHGQPLSSPIFVVVNLCDEPAPYVRFHAPSLEDGIWCEYLTGETIKICKGQFDGNLAPSGAHIYLRSPLE